MLHGSIQKNKSGTFLWTTVYMEAHLLCRALSYNEGQTQLSWHRTIYTPALLTDWISIPETSRLLCRTRQFSVPSAAVKPAPSVFIVSVRS